jgi:hypothetical protein
MNYPANALKSFTISLFCEKFEYRAPTTNGGNEPLSRVFRIAGVQLLENRSDELQTFCVRSAGTGTLGPEMQRSAVNVKHASQLLPCKPRPPSDVENGLRGWGCPLVKNGPDRGARLSKQLISFQITKATEDGVVRN